MVKGGCRILALSFALLLLTGLFTGAGAQQAEDKSAQNNTAEAEKFFRDCVKRPIVSTSDETDMAFCACTATQMQAWLDKPAQLSGPDYFQTFRTKDLDKNAMITEIYAPCLYIPMFDISYDDCLESKKHRFFFNRQDLLEATCQCMAQGDSEYFQKFAKPYLELKVTEGVDILDPITEVKKDVNYYDAHYHLESNCYAEYSQYD